MTGAEQDRQEAKSVDQDERANDVAETADERNALHRLHAEQGQSPWIDFIDRELLTSGKLDRMVNAGIRGLTSNPTTWSVERSRRATMLARSTKRSPSRTSAARRTSCAVSTTSPTGPMASRA